MALSQVGVQEGSDKYIATHEFNEGSFTKHIERICIGTGILELPSSPQISSINTSGIYPTDPIDVSGLGYIIIKSHFTNNSDTASIRLVLYDINGNIIGQSDVQNITATDLTEGSEYVGDLIVFENKLGVSKVKIKLENNLSSGTVSFWISGV